MKKKTIIELSPTEKEGLGKKLAQDIRTACLEGKKAGFSLSDLNADIMGQSLVGVVVDWLNKSGLEE